MQLYLIISAVFILLAATAYPLEIDLSVNKAFIAEPLYFNYNSAANEFSTEIMNSGSLPYIAQIRTDVIDDSGDIVFTGWSERKKMMPGNNGFFQLRWLPTSAGNYTTRYRVYYSGEVNETIRSITVDEIRNATDVFEINFESATQDFMIIKVKSSYSGKAAIVPYDYPQGWWIAQRTVELKEGTNTIILPYGPLTSAETISFAVISENGEYASTASVNLFQNKSILGWILKLLG